MDKILNYGDVVEIGRFLRKNKYDLLDIDIVVYVKTRDDLRKVNEDFYYRNKEGEQKEELPPDYEVDEVAVNISNTCKVTYRVKEVEETQKETTTTTKLLETNTTTEETTTTTKKAEKDTSTTTNKTVKKTKTKK